jgi:hypothetical protein
MAGAITRAAERLDAPSQGTPDFAAPPPSTMRTLRCGAWPLRVPRVSRMKNAGVRPVTGLPDSARSGRYSVRGISKRKVLPAPGALDTVMLPSWSARMCLTIDRPRPVPPLSRERALSTR